MLCVMLLLWWYLVNIYVRILISLASLIIWCGDSGGIRLELSLQDNMQMKYYTARNTNIHWRLSTNSNISMAMSLKVTRPDRLTNDETLTSFEDWKNNITFYLTQDKDFAVLLKETTTWTKSSDADTNHGRSTPENRAALDRFLGLIASLAPPLLYHEIIDDTTSISDVFRLLRSYYQFSPSESTFMKYCTTVSRERLWMER